MQSWQWGERWRVRVEIDLGGWILVSIKGAIHAMLRVVYFTPFTTEKSWWFWGDLICISRMSLRCETECLKRLEPGQWARVNMTEVVGLQRRGQMGNIESITDEGFCYGLHITMRVRELKISWYFLCGHGIQSPRWFPMTQTSWNSQVLQSPLTLYPG